MYYLSCLLFIVLTLHKHFNELGLRYVPNFLGVKIFKENLPQAFYLLDQTAFNLPKQCSLLVFEIAALVIAGLRFI